MFIDARRTVILLFMTLMLVSCTGEGRKALFKGGAGGEENKGLSVWIIPDEPASGQELLAVVSGHKGAVSYEWSVNGKGIEGQNAEKFHGDLRPGDKVTVTVTGLSGDNESRSSSVVVKNAPPVVSGVRLTPDEVSAGADITAHPVATDADGDHVRFGFRWFVNGAPVVAGDGPVLDKTLFKRGDKVTVKVTPFDGVDFGRPFAVEVTVPNAAPVFTSTPAVGFRGRVYKYRAVAEDPDGDEVRLSLVRAPESMVMDRDGLIMWTIGPDDAGSHMVELSARDPEGAKSTQSYEVTIEMPNG